MKQKQWEFFRILAISSCVASLASVILMAVSIPLIYIQIEEENTFIAMKAKQFRVYNREQTIQFLKLKNQKVKHNLEKNYKYNKFPITCNLRNEKKILE